MAQGGVRQRPKKAAGISNAAVERATGRELIRWFKKLDAAGGEKLDHKGIVAAIDKIGGAGAWWRQTIAGAYERSRGLRDWNETPEGWQVGVSKIFDAPLAKLYAMFAEEKKRALWLGKTALEQRTCQQNKSARFAWGTSRIDIYFTAKGDDRAQAALGHIKLKDAADVEKMRKFWKGAFARLEEVLAAR